MKTPSQKGFSLLELLVVLVVIAILVSISLVSLYSRAKYAAEDQAINIIDFFNEARQKALNQRNTFRVEINQTRKQLNLIDENAANTASDDVIVRSLPLLNNVVIGAKPSNAANMLTLTSPVPVPSPATTSYPLSSGESKITLRFRRNGEVVDAGSDNIGTGSLVTGATLFTYSLRSGSVNADVVRAVTLLGSSGDTDLYRCTFNSSGVCTNWTR
jgi:prepilin-type N-terminal cleavage/methylation domain-containing protein